MELNWNDFVRGVQRLEDLQRLDAIVIEVNSAGVDWRVFGDGHEEIICLPARPQHFARLLMMTETLLNAEFGLQDRQLCPFRLN